MPDVGDALSEVAVEWGTAAPDFLSDVCDVKRYVAQAGAQVLSTVHASVPCGRPKPRGGGPGADAIRGKTTYLIVMPAAIGGTTLNTTKTEDLITVHANGFIPERTYKVKSPEDEQGIKVIARCTIES